MKVKKDSPKKKNIDKKIQSISESDHNMSNDSSSDEDTDEECEEIKDASEVNEKILAELDDGESSDDSEQQNISTERIKEKKPIPTKISITDEQTVIDSKQLAYDKKDEKKTVFCGNIPNGPNVNETRIKDLFSEYGSIKSVRFRTESGQIIFSKKVRKGCKSFLAYIVFEKEEDAKKSIQLNGFKLLEHHLRVNMANNKKEAFSNKGTVFVGNLPFEASESEIHDHFSDIGKIEYVRKIAKKGIAYVCFQKGVSIIKALSLNDKPFKGRNLRVTRAESKDKQEKKKLFKKDPKSGKFLKQKVRKPHKIHMDTLLRGRKNNNPIIKKIKETQKAKFNKFTDANQLSKKELFRKGGKMYQNHRDDNREKFKKKEKFFGAKVDGLDKRKNKKSKTSKSIKHQKVIAKKLKSAAERASEKM
ncbi:CLUMA_CG014462, isoform A [Clunio marinus]|uniref:CLUMA_CG014462, isoform A n=1 Tax=Clunio marinus TaxID=568069 RepID=A0A1J1IPS4_9DIPT|nr:CLUMA_CG014462, isoform A [Clunio marinus]